MQYMHRAFSSPGMLNVVSMTTSETAAESWDDRPLIAGTNSSWMASSLWVIGTGVSSTNGMIDDPPEKCDSTNRQVGIDASVLDSAPSISSCVTCRSGGSSCSTSGRVGRSGLLNHHLLGKVDTWGC